MSHFSVLVIGDNVEEQLAPFHQFECTGQDDEYVKDVDDTEEMREEFNTHITTRYKDPDGNLHDPFQDQFYRELTQEEKDTHNPMGTGWGSGLSWTSKDWEDGLGYRSKIHFVPEGWIEVQVLEKEVSAFAKFIEYWSGHEVVPFGKEPDLADTHKYGYILVDKQGEVVKSVNRTNPNYHWDWYSVGGRWGGFFKLKTGAEGEIGTPGVFGRMRDDIGYADQCLKGDVDTKSMAAEAKKEAEEAYDEAMEATKGIEPPTWKSWEELEKSMMGKDIDAIREAYWEHPFIKALKVVDNWGPDQYLVSRETYVSKAVTSAFSTFAILKDGKWYERGEMGWFGCVSDKKTPQDWNELFNNIWESIPDTTLLTVVDCHI